MNKKKIKQIYYYACVVYANTLALQIKAELNLFIK